MASYLDSDMKAALGLGLTVAVADYFRLPETLGDPVAGVVGGLTGRWTTPVVSVLYYTAVGWIYLKFIQPQVQRM